MSTLKRLGLVAWGAFGMYLGYQCASKGAAYIMCGIFDVDPAEAETTK